MLDSSKSDEHTPQGIFEIMSTIITPRSVGHEVQFLKINHINSKFQN